MKKMNNYADADNWWEVPIGIRIARWGGGFLLFYIFYFFITLLSASPLYSFRTWGRSIMKTLHNHVFWGIHLLCFILTGLFVLVVSVTLGHSDSYD